MTQIILRVITSALITLCLPILIDILRPKIDKDVGEEESKAKDKKAYTFIKK